MTVINYFQKGFGRNLLPRFSLRLVQDERSEACLTDSNLGLRFNLRTNHDIVRSQ